MENKKKEIKKYSSGMQCNEQNKITKTKFYVNALFSYRSIWKIKNKKNIIGELIYVCHILLIKGM